MTGTRFSLRKSSTSVALWHRALSCMKRKVCSVATWIVSGLQEVLTSHRSRKTGRHRDYLDIRPHQCPRHRKQSKDQAFHR
jgi:hypothetical protein